MPAFRTLWVRSLVVPSLLIALAVGLVLDSVGTTSWGASLGRAADQTTTWRTSYSVRFPGCVALVLWPRTEVPDAVVVREHGDVAMMPMRDAMVRLTRAERPHQVQLVGACRAKKTAEGAAAVR